MSNKLFRAIIQNKVSHNVTEVDNNYAATSTADNNTRYKKQGIKSAHETTRSNMRRPVAGTKLADIGRETFNNTNKNYSNYQPADKRQPKANAEYVNDEKNMIRNIIQKEARIVQKKSYTNSAHSNNQEIQTLGQIAKEKLN